MFERTFQLTEPLKRSCWTPRFRPVSPTGVIIRISAKRHIIITCVYIVLRWHAFVLDVIDREYRLRYHHTNDGFSFRAYHQSRLVPLDLSLVSFKWVGKNSNTGWSITKKFFLYLLYRVIQIWSLPLRSRKL